METEVAATNEAAASQDEVQRRGGGKGGGESGAAERDREAPSSSSRDIDPAISNAQDAAHAAVDCLERLAPAGPKGGGGGGGGGAADTNPLSDAFQKETTRLSALLEAVDSLGRCVQEAAAARIKPFSLDLETSGSSPARSCITNLCAIDVADPSQLYHAFCDIGTAPLSWYSKKNSPITPELRREKGITVFKAMRGLAEFIEGRLGRGQIALLVAHNGRAFDDHFLFHALSSMDDGWIRRHWHGFDTLRLVRPLAKERPDLKLPKKKSQKSLSDHYKPREGEFGVNPGRRHTALADATELVRVASRLAEDALRPLPTVEGSGTEATGAVSGGANNSSNDGGEF